ncbi:methyltransferase domain-containing protein [Actinomadura logoneensis]|uniref:Methyltransferase domain-containing protein n=1 Tax=Actinomadura logoneensis TaxID=2293572 RepID=A0A372JAE3_9ACTN|nr:methyltransferase domain-containing protein [Actinomadura logoneensis]RFU36991.1 methyltransferase domain-containing protein [Actinomadura logoneensis]
MRITNERVLEVFDAIAGRYDRQMATCERWLFPGSRAWVTRRAAGRVVEIAVGTGLNLPLYPDEVVSVVGIDLSEAMLAVARERVRDEKLGDRVELRRGDVQRAGLPDGCADTVVSTFTLCSIPDADAAVGEAYRMLRPGGRFVLAEHGPSSNLVVRTLMRAVEPLVVRFSADHLTRDPRPMLRRAGFRVEQVERGRLGVSFRILAVRPE